MSLRDSLQCRNNSWKSSHQMYSAYLQSSCCCEHFVNRMQWMCGLSAEKHKSTNLNKTGWMFSRLICSITVEYFDPWFAYSMEIEKKQKTTTFCSRHHATTSLAEFEVFVAHPETGIELSGRPHKTHSCSVLLNNLAVCLFETNSFCQFSCLIGLWSVSCNQA